MACLEHVKTFLQCKDLNYPELEDPDWLEKLHFMVDMTSHFNALNTSLQGQGRTELQMLEDKRKLTVFTRDVDQGTLSHFSLRVFKEAHNHTVNCDYLRRAIIEMKTAFLDRFTEFRKAKNKLSFPITPLDINPSLLNMPSFPGVNLPNLEIELADIADKDL